MLTAKARTDDRDVLMGVAVAEAEHAGDAPDDRADEPSSPPAASPPAGRYETLSLPLEIHEANAEEGTFTGLASAFGTLIDTFPPTRIHRGSFRKTIREQRSRVKVLWQHSPDWPIGVPTRMRETEAGLEVTAKITQNTQMGREALALMREGIVTELSIGFDAVKFDFQEEKDIGMVRHIREVRLWEFSPVTFAANAGAVIRSVNRRDDVPPSLEALLSEVRQRLEGLDLTDAARAALTAHRDAIADVLRQAEPPGQAPSPALTARLMALREAQLEHARAIAGKWE